MTDIRCTVTNCYYNKRVGCTAPSIKVDGINAHQSRGTSCDTFAEQKPGVQSSTADPNHHSHITCSAVNCQYNKSEVCEATDVLVNGKNAERPEETCCSTFDSTK